MHVHHIYSEIDEAFHEAGSLPQGDRDRGTKHKILDRAKKRIRFLLVMVLIGRVQKIEMPKPQHRSERR